jgi:hypothetical protein
MAQILNRISGRLHIKDQTDCRMCFICTSAKFIKENVLIDLHLNTMIIKREEFFLYTVEYVYSMYHNKKYYIVLVEHSGIDILTSVWDREKLLERFRIKMENSPGIYLDLIFFLQIHSQCK